MAVLCAMAAFLGVAIHLARAQERRRRAGQRKPDPAFVAAFIASRGKGG